MGTGDDTSGDDTSGDDSIRVVSFDFDWFSFKDYQ